ncbi:sulfurtransferase [Photobacterium sp. MCCC 1A19761]|uniref:sulfurtransferase n=1 Tax=Photobacterium sp. MCCC 1A19761 TaxID=3115000 RepID=UPI00307EE18B
MEFPLVTTHWLAEHLHLENLVILDASMGKVVGKQPIVYDQPIFIPKSQRLDLETTFCDLASDQIHAFPTVQQFTSAAQSLGINADSLVVIYDNQGVYSSPRVWWIFQAMGFGNAFVLDGGLPQWLAENRDTVSTVAPETKHFGNIEGEALPGRICDSQYILERLDREQITVLDVRAQDRFLGRAPEPRAGVRSGHIPGALNLPFTEVLDGHGLKSPAQLTQIFDRLLVNQPNQLIFSCGSGITACVVLLAAVIAGYQNTVLYDGSWSDWGSQPSLPIE